MRRKVYANETLRSLAWHQRRLRRLIDRCKGPKRAEHQAMLRDVNEDIAREERRVKAKNR